MTRLLSTVAVTVMCGALPGAATAVVLPAAKCAAKQLKAAGKDAACQATQLASGLRGGTADLTKCSTTFDTAFMKSLADGSCPGTVDGGVIDGHVNALLDSILTQVAGTCDPQTCGPQVCGIISDGCGGFLDCGVCENPCTTDADCINTRVCELGRCEPKLADGWACNRQNDCLSLCCCDEGSNLGTAGCTGLYFPDGSVHAVPGICQEPANCSVSGNGQCPGALAPSMDICQAGGCIF